VKSPSDVRWWRGTAAHTEPKQKMCGLAEAEDARRILGAIRVVIRAPCHAVARDRAKKFS